MDDTVLEDHNEDPCLVQIRVIGDGGKQLISMPILKFYKT